MYTKHILHSLAQPPHGPQEKGAGYAKLSFTRGLSVEMAMISEDYFELESCIRLDISCERRVELWKGGGKYF